MIIPWRPALWSSETVLCPSREKLEQIVSRCSHLVVVGGGKISTRDVDKCSYTNQLFNFPSSALHVMSRVDTLMTECSALLLKFTWVIYVLDHMNSPRIRPPFRVSLLILLWRSAAIYLDCHRELLSSTLQSMIAYQSRFISYIFMKLQFCEVECPLRVFVVL